ncbi:Vegetative incompatibility protein HET-E-1 [Rhizoctonia solani]|uniref:Vegetative incompatibility protein HET-E-1 n=1 Tax=Rhizoctonia solani TaxID=456999 RepID=A0A8H8SZG7_9AGAM|nr:Vegetative incompatibility protein HET-E-1 [Rhizoctonia solani]QRW22393.1 Vegetative incompatibility protein HET-E-1 [Rhizoctonia solani]
MISGHLDDGQVDDDQLHKERVYVLPGVVIMFCEYGRLQRAGHAPSCYKRSRDERSLSVYSTTTNTRKMSTRNNRSRNKKGKVRRWLDSLLCVSSPESSPAPSAHRDSTSHRPLASEPASSGQNTEPSRQNIIPSTNEPRLTVPSDSLPVPSALNAEPQIPPPVLARAHTRVPDSTAKVDGAKGTESGSPSSTPNPELVDDQSHAVDEAAPATTTAEPAEATNKTWAGLPGSLRKLMSVAGLIPSVGDAARVLLDCVDTTEVAVDNKQDYEDLATELTALSNTLAQQIEGMGSEAVSKCVSGVAHGIEKQAKEIKKKKERGTARRLLEASSDEEDVMRHYRRIQSLFRQLQANLSMNTWSVANDLMVKTLLKDLGPEMQAAYDSALSETVGRRICTEGTRTKVLSDLVEWVHDKNAPAIYWMNGMAGTGKTTIAYSFAEWLEKHELLAGSFFCTRTSAACRDAAKIVPTVVYQLARYSATFQSALCDILNAASDAGSKSISKQFEALLKEALQKTVEKGKGDALDNLVVVIDALDECEDQRGVETIVDMLFRYAPHLGLKFFVTSRPEPGIYTKMTANVDLRGGMVLHDIEKSLVSKDIKLYLEQELARIPVDVSDMDLEGLVDRSGALFIYAATLVRYIRTVKVDPYDRLQAILHSTPGADREHPQIDELYTAILKSALEDKDLGEPDKERIRAVLRTVLMAQEPIGVETIALLAGIDGSRRVEYALLPLRSVLHQSESTGLVSTLHASFPDFMFSPTRSGSYFCDMDKHSPRMARRCFAVMKDQLRFNICDLPSSFIPDDNVDNLQDRIKHRVSPSLAYVCRYWASHVSVAPANDDLLEDLSVFLSERLLFWMEVMSLRRELLAGIEGFLALKQWLRRPDAVVHKKTKSQASKVATLIEDAINFYTSYASSGACRCTPHIYISCLPFCPRSSTVYKQYWPRMQGLVELKGSLMDRRETAALATWNIPSPVLSVAYSGDGSRVAVGCEDGTVSIRNAYDGTLLVGPWNAHTDYVRSIVFSPDGRLVASGSTDCTIGVWDVRTGSPVVGPFHGHTGDVNSVSFSPDSKRIVSGSFDNTVCIWDTADGTLLVGPLHGHTASVRSVTFSPDGTLIASASKDETIRLWRSDDGTPAASPLQGHTHSVNSVTFTPDGTRLVSGSSDKTVRVWRVSDGSAVATPFQGHSDAIYSVAVSPDGMLVASGSRDRTVRVWRISDGLLAAGPFVGHINRILSVGYSPDGTRVISGSIDGTVRVWNVREGMMSPASSEVDLSFITSLSFLPDGAHVLTVSRGGEMRMWDVSNGISQPAPPDIQVPHPPSHAASPDRSYTAETDTYGRLVQVVRTDDKSVAAGPFDRTPEAWHFSHNSTCVIAGFWDGRIEGICLETGQTAFQLRSANNHHVSLIAECPDHSLLASFDSGSFNTSPTIQIWSMAGPTLCFQSSDNPSLDPGPGQTLSGLYDQCHIDRDGWMVNKSNELLLWLPSEIADAGLSPFVWVIVTGSGTLQLPKRMLVTGDQWYQCYVQH